jgi:preprotein translocase subunit SecA
MGIWNWLSGNRVSRPIVQDVIWMNQEAKLRGFCKEARERLADSLVLALAHFPSTLAKVEAAFKENAVPYAVAGGSLAAVPSLAGRGGQAAVVLSLATITSGQDIAEPTHVEAGPVTILVAERFFLRAADEEIEKFAATLGAACRLRFHLALDDPLLREFAGEWTGGMLRALGMSEADSIESPLISRRLRTAQERMAGRVTDERPAESPEEWWKINAQRN